MSQTIFVVILNLIQDQLYSATLPNEDVFILDPGSKSGMTDTESLTWKRMYTLLSYCHTLKLRMNHKKRHLA